MSCSVIKPMTEEIKCADVSVRYFLKVKPYVYEVINGKRKRVSPFVIENGVVTEIKQRAIIQVFKS